jgi:hypothetical protein
MGLTYFCAGLSQLLLDPSIDATICPLFRAAVSASPSTVPVFHKIVELGEVHPIVP